MGGEKEGLSPVVESEIKRLDDEFGHVWKHFDDIEKLRVRAEDVENARFTARASIVIAVVTLLATLVIEIIRTAR